MPPKIDNYYNRFDESKNYVELLFRDGYGAQGAEQNEQQAIMNAKIRKLGRSIYKDGDIVQGAQIVVDPESGHVSATSGDVFLNGFIWTVPAAEFDIPVTGTVAVGVHLEESVISELEDPALRNPARGQRSEGEPGAWRKKVEARWGFDADGAADTTFYPVYTVDDGVQRAKEAPPSLDSVNQALARYDRDSTGTGTYASSGLIVVMGEDLEDGRQVYHLSEGRARVAGKGVDLPTSRRILYPAQPDLRVIGMEIVDATQTAQSESGQRIEAAHTPIKRLVSLRITAEATFDLVHGSFTGCSDALPVTGVISIQEVRQLDTVFEAGTDYVKKGDQIDWSPLGNEPAAGSTLQATIRYLKDVEPVLMDLDGFVVKDAVPGTQILFSYEQMLPRYDRMAIDSEGQVTWFKGVASEYNPQRPPVPDNLLALATVYQNWRPDRQIFNDSARVVPFEDIAAIRTRLDAVEQEVARNRLEMDAATRESGARKGYFVDPLLDDSMRDQGIPQTAAIVGGDLTLPITDAASFEFPGDVKTQATRPFTVKVLLEQPFRTTDKAVNPYMAFEPLPAKVTLVPAIDQWTEVKTNWASAITETFRRSRDGGWAARWRGGAEDTSVTTTQKLSSTTTKLEYLRQIDVAFEIEGFGPGEILQKITFDGVEVTPQEA